MIDVKEIERKAREEIADELATSAKGKLKGKLKAIAQAEQVVANLRREYSALLLEGTEAL